MRRGDVDGEGDAEVAEEGDAGLHDGEVGVGAHCDGDDGGAQVLRRLGYERQNEGGGGFALSADGVGEGDERRDGGLDVGHGGADHGDVADFAAGLGGFAVHVEGGVGEGDGG